MGWDDTPKRFGEITRVLRAFSARHLLDVYAEAVEKHGSWEWLAGQPGVINRSVAVDLTEESSYIDGPPTYVAELWIIADDNRRYTRRLISAFRMAGVSPTGFEGDLDSRLVFELTRAWKILESLSEPDLTDSYIVARGLAPD